MRNRGTRHGLILVAIAFVFGSEVLAAPLENLVGREVSLIGVGSISGEATDLSGLAQTLTPKLGCLLYTSPSPRDQRGSRMPSSA